MQLVRSLERPVTNRPVILTMGRFDGVHEGHQFLIRSTIARARTLGKLSAVLTWEPHPNTIIRPDQPLHLLTTLEERIDEIAALEPDILIVAPFTRETMDTSARDYMGKICRALTIRELWVGADFAMGHHREGSITQLAVMGQNLGYRIEAVERREIAGDEVSSSRIRELLLGGDVVSASMLLGYTFGRHGIVIDGDKRGRTIGFPTANLAIAPELVLPADGVYACRVNLQDVMIPAVTNIGMRPTFSGAQRAVETHLLDWSGDLYGRELHVQFSERLRGELKFAGIAELIAQITYDVSLARELLS